MKSKKVFIASDTFVAFIDRQHPKYLHAEAFFRYFSLEKYYLYTDIISINQSADTIRKNISTSLAKDFLKSILTGNLNILYPEETDFKKSIEILARSQSEVSLENALIAVLCNQKDIRQICTFEYLHSFFGLQPFYLPI